MKPSKRRAQRAQSASYAHVPLLPLPQLQQAGQLQQLPPLPQSQLPRQEWQQHAWLQGPPGLHQECLPGLHVIESWQWQGQKEWKTGDLFIPA